jgi:hypothetical protein
MRTIPRSRCRAIFQGGIVPAPLARMPSAGIRMTVTEALRRFDYDYNTTAVVGHPFTASQFEPKAASGDDADKQRQSQ